MNGFTTKLIVCYPVNNKLGRFQALEIYHSKYSRVHLNKILIVFFFIVTSRGYAMSKCTYINDTKTKNEGSH